MNFIRCFISAELPEDVKSYLERLNEEFGRTSGVNFVPKENMHLTLAFLGEINAPELEEIVRKTGEIAGCFGPIPCSLGKIDAIPQKRPRLIWVSVNDGKRLSEIHTALKSAIGFEEQGREFDRHITLARIKSASAAGKISQKVRELKILQMNFRIERICVMESRLAPEGAAYSVIKRMNLK